MGGKGKGKGWRSGGNYGGYGGKGRTSAKEPAELSPERREELSAQINVFQAEVAALSFRFPATLNGVERRVAHALAEEAGLESQSFGEGIARCLHVFKPPPAEVPDESELPPIAAAVSEECGVSYSGVELGKPSLARLTAALGVPLPSDDEADEATGMMVICPGPLSAPRSQDNRSSAEQTVEQIQALKVGQPVTLYAVSIGRWPSGSVLAGTIGCPSTLRTPHIEIVVPGGARERKGGKPIEWEPLATPVTLHGRVREWQQKEKAKMRASSEKRRDAHNDLPPLPLRVLLWLVGAGCMPLALQQIFAPKSAVRSIVTADAFKRHWSPLLEPLVSWCGFFFLCLAAATASAAQLPYRRARTLLRVMAALWIFDGAYIKHTVFARSGFVRHQHSRIAGSADCAIGLAIAWYAFRPLPPPAGRGDGQSSAPTRQQQRGGGK